MPGKLWNLIRELPKIHSLTHEHDLNHNECGQLTFFSSSWFPFQLSLIFQHWAVPNVLNLHSFNIPEDEVVRIVANSHLIISSRGLVDWSRRQPWLAFIREVVDPSAWHALYGCMDGCWSGGERLGNSGIVLYIFSSAVQKTGWRHTCRQIFGYLCMQFLKRIHFFIFLKHAIYS